MDAEPSLSSRLTALKSASAAFSRSGALQRKAATVAGQVRIVNDNKEAIEHMAANPLSGLFYCLKLDRSRLAGSVMSASRPVPSRSLAQVHTTEASSREPALHEARTTTSWQTNGLQPGPSCKTASMSSMGLPCPRGSRRARGRELESDSG
jgi:hypothetical protein